MEIDVRRILTQCLGEEIDPLHAATHYHSVCARDDCPCDTPGHRHYYLDLTTGMGYCFRCSWGYSLKYYLARLLDVSVSHAEYLVHGDRATSLGDVRVSSAFDPDRYKTRLPLFPSVRPLSHWEAISSHPYLTGRGITGRGITDMGLMYAHKGAMAGRIVVPLHDAHGRCVGYSGRTTRKYGLKNLYPAGFPKKQLFYNEKVFLTSPWAVVVEGELGDTQSVLRVTPNVVASYGKSVSQEQCIRARKLGARDLFLMFDGGEDIDKAKRRLDNFNFRVHIVSLPEGKDPGNLTADEVDDALRRSQLVTNSRAYDLGRVYSGPR